MLSADQTRGLLSYINEKFPGAYESNVKYTSVISKDITGGISGTDLEKLLAFVSYSALLGKGKEVAGDGIIPVETAFLQNAKNIIVGEREEVCRHSNFVPSPLNSIKLPFNWYGSNEVVKQWIDNI